MNKLKTILLIVLSGIFITAFILSILQINTKCCNTVGNTRSNMRSNMQSNIRNNMRSNMRSNIKKANTTTKNAYSCQWNPTSQKCMGIYNDRRQNAVNPITKSNLKNFWYCPYGDKLHKKEPSVVKNKIYCCDKNGNCPEPSPQSKYFTTPAQVKEIEDVIGPYPATRLSWFKFLACGIVDEDYDSCYVPNSVYDSFDKNGQSLAASRMFLDKNGKNIDLEDLKFYKTRINGKDSLWSDCYPTDNNTNPCGISYMGNIR